MFIYTTNGHDTKFESGSDIELDFGQNKSKNHVFNCYGIFKGVEVLIEVTISAKMHKIRGCGATFCYL